MLDHFLSRFSDHQPVLVSPESAGRFESCLRGGAEWMGKAQEHLAASAHDNFWHDQGSWLSAYQPYVVRDGVLQIPVSGLLVNNFNYAIGFMTGYDYIWQAFKRGMEDGGVRGIALVSDSPGGFVSGCFDAVDKMFEAKSAGNKPVSCFVSDMACSAAYAVASLADEIVMTRTATVGSIGVVVSHYDLSKMYENAGVKVTFIHAGAHKVDGNPYEPLPEEVKARIQARINETYEVFVSTVARNRAALSEQAARDSEALTYGASEATSNGFADKVGAIDDSLAEFTASLNLNEGDDKMAEITQADHEAAVQAAVAEAANTARAEGAAAEKTRIVAILGSDEAKVRPSAALAAALDTEMSAEATVKFLAKLPEEKLGAAEPTGSTMLDSMNAKGSLNLSADVLANGDDDGEKLDIVGLARTFGLANFKPQEPAR